MFLLESELQLRMVGGWFLQHQSDFVSTKALSSESTPGYKQNKTYIVKVPGATVYIDSQIFREKHNCSPVN